MLRVLVDVHFDADVDGRDFLLASCGVASSASLRRLLFAPIALITRPCRCRCRSCCYLMAQVVRSKAGPSLEILPLEPFLCQTAEKLPSHSQAMLLILSNSSGFSVRWWPHVVENSLRQFLA